MEEDLQKILKNVLKARVFSSNKSCKKFLTARLSYIYYGKSHIKCYNFCQKCKDNFAIAEAKGPNQIFWGLILM